MKKSPVFQIDDKDLEGNVFNKLPLETNSFDSDSKEKKFIKKVESIIRNSPEYKEWRNFILTFLGDSYCFLSGEIVEQVTIQLHHHPFTLYDIVSIIIHKNLMLNKGFTSYSIASDVMKEHYAGNVGYIPLTVTLHEKYHNGFQHIPIDLVKGNYTKFIDKYKNYISDDLLNIINTKKNCVNDDSVKIANELEDTYLEKLNIDDLVN